MKTGHVPHALLFSGMAGIGKLAVAREFAKLLNCLDPQGLDCCDRCSSCRKIQGGHHPDILWLKSEGVFIKIDQVRDLRERMHYRPFEGRWRVMVIEDAQKLKEEAANSLLKLLEEPPKQNLFLLSALEPQMLLPTIVSRCCHIRFQPLDNTVIERHLIEARRMPPEQAREVARLAEGSLERARWLAEEDRITHWKDILKNLSKLGELSMIDLFAMTAQWAQKIEDLEHDLECIKLWARDLVLSRLLKDHRPAFELDTTVQRAIQGVSIDYLFHLYDLIERAAQHLRRNVNKQLMLEGVCLAIKEGLYGPKDRRNSFS